MRTELKRMGAGETMWLLLCLSVVGSVLSQEAQVTDECPTKFGFYADAVQCDRYYECKDGQIIDHHCPDGLVFDESSEAFAKCSFPFSVDCSDRPELQPPQPTTLCPRRNGYFAHENPDVCDKFYFCVDGVANQIVCPETLIFDPSKGQCAFSDQVSRPGCTSEEVFQFVCPRNFDAPHEHPRYPDPADCQYFYICIGGKSARRNGCTVGLVFNPDTLACDRPANVQGECRNWYNETFLEGLRASAPRREASRVPGGGVPLKALPSTGGRRRVAVRRRKPTGGIRQQQVQLQQAQDVEVQEPPAPSSVNNNRVRAGLPGSRFSGGSRVPLRPAATANSGRQRNRVRTRVRPRPQQQQEQPTATGSSPPPGPPEFSLSSDEAIQRFRQSNRFVPEAGQNPGGGRLTVLSSSSRGRPRTRVPEEVREDSDFSSFAAVPSRTPPRTFADVEETGGFGGRIVQSRRTPQSVQEEPEEPEEPEGSLPESIHTDPFQTVFGQTGPRRSTSRSRLQVTSINVQPQFDLARDDPLEPIEIGRIQNARSRGRQG